MENEEIKAKIIICGGRHFDDYHLLETLVDSIVSSTGLTNKEIEIVSGHCKGADLLGELYAQNHSMRCRIFPAEWKKYGKAAGPIRNSQMVNYAANSQSPTVVAFVSPRTKGTLDTIKKATKKGFVVFQYGYDPDGQ